MRAEGELCKEIGFMIYRTNVCQDRKEDNYNNRSQVVMQLNDPLSYLFN